MVDPIAHILSQRCSSAEFGGFEVVLGSSCTSFRSTNLIESENICPECPLKADSTRGANSKGERESNTQPIMWFFPAVNKGGD